MEDIAHIEQVIASLNDTEKQSHFQSYFYEQYHDISLLIVSAFRENMPYIRKQSAQLASKMRYMTAQYVPYLENNRWWKNAVHANACARRLADVLAEFPQIHLTQKVESNQLFFTIPSEPLKKLQENYFFYMWNEETNEARFVTSWDTTEEDILGLEAFLHEILK